MCTHDVSKAVLAVPGTTTSHLQYCLSDFIYGNINCLQNTYVIFAYCSYKFKIRICLSMTNLNCHLLDFWVVSILKFIILKNYETFVVL